MTNPLHHQVAQELFKAEQSRKQIGLVSKRFPDWTMADAYAVQAALVRRKLTSGRRIIGWKIGLTSKAMQDALKIAVPDSGVLFDDMLFDHGATVPSGRYIQPRIEAEIAFIMRQNLEGPITDRREVLEATAHVCPSLEILDTRILRIDPETKAPRTFVDTIADNAANAGIVLGRERQTVEAFDLRWVGAILKRNGEVEETGLGAGVLDDPLTSMLWLVNRLAETGSHISAGDIVLSGSFIRPVEARGSDRFVADFGAFGSVAVNFA
jgi:2-oxo-hept-3-ene-1,7-dioate hydratase